MLSIAELTPPQSVEDFSHEAAMKAARNASYVVRIKKAQENTNAGNYTYLTNEELRKMAYAL